MRVLYLSHGFTPHDRRFLRALAARHEIRCASLSDAAFDDLPYGVTEVSWARPAHAARPRDVERAEDGFRELLAAVQPDAVHAGPVTTSAYLAARAGFRPLVAMSWGFDLLLDAVQDPAAEVAARFVLERSDALLCDSEATRRKAIDLGADGDRISRFPWGVELDRFAIGSGGQEVRSRLGWPHAKVIIWTRAHDTLHGFDVGLEAFGIALRDDPRLRLLLLGAPGPDTQARIAANGIAHAVAVLGAVEEEDLPRYFSASDVYLSCARTDGTSVSLLQAMACGLPIVVSDLPGNREWIAHGEGGWLAPDGDARAFARWMVVAASLDEEARHKVAGVNRWRVERDADWAASTRALLGIYDRLERERAMP